MCNLGFEAPSRHVKKYALFAVTDTLTDSKTGKGRLQHRYRQDLAWLMNTVPRELIGDMNVLLNHSGASLGPLFAI